MFGFIKKCFFTAITFFSYNVLIVDSLECVSMNNQECKIRSEINTNKPMFYPYSITINKCLGSCNTINDPYAKLCFPDTIKNINVKVFNLMSRTNLSIKLLTFPHILLHFCNRLLSITFKTHCLITIKTFNITNHLRKLYTYWSNNIIIIIYSEVCR